MSVTEICLRPNGYSNPRGSGGNGESYYTKNFGKCEDNVEGGPGPGRDSIDMRAYIRPGSCQTLKYSREAGGVGRNPKTN